MRFEFFKHQIERLRGIYSPGALNEDRVDIWWKRFRNEPDHVFENALNHIIAESTGHQLPAMSKVAEALGFFRNNGNSASMHVLPVPYDCEACRDHGFGFVEDTIIACSCCNGRRMSPDELVKKQKGYDVGRAKFTNPKEMLDHFANNVVIKN